MTSEEQENLETDEDVWVKHHPEDHLTPKVNVDLRNVLIKSGTLISLENYFVT